MSYVLCALIARQEVLEAGLASGLEVRPVPLAQGFALVPLPEEVCGRLDELAADHSGAAEVPDFLSPGVARLARGLSQGGAVAFVELEMWAGMGSRSSVVWRDGEVAAGPFHSADLWKREGETSRVECSGNCENAVNEALGALGVSRAGHHDEFDALGLGRHRRTEGWR